MLPMITVAGTPNIRPFNLRWNRAVAPSQWWQNPNLSFGAGAPVQVPSSSIAIDPPPIQANVAAAPRRPRGGAETMCHDACAHHGVGIKFHRCYQECLAGTLTTGIPRPGGRPSKPARRRRRRIASAQRRGVSAGTHRMVSAEQAKEMRLFNCSWEDVPGYGKSLCCDYPGASGTRICISRRRRNTSVGHAGGSCCGGGCPGCECGNGSHDRASNPSTVDRGGVIYSPTPTMRLAPPRMANSCLSECIASGEDMYNCMGKCLTSATQVHGRRITPSRAPGRGARMRPTRGRRLANRATSRLRASRVTPGRIAAVPGVRKACPDGWTKKEYISGTKCCWRPSKYIPWFCRPLRKNNPSTVAIGDIIFSPPTTSRLLNRARRRVESRRKGTRVTVRPGKTRGRPETLADCLYLCDAGDAKCRQDCFHKHRPTR